ncbi:hypothetical protein JEZ13_04185 [bacterium]|nr:hypothetical protein [bacterium]MBI9072942.1 hypothetical protein [Melioribacteraceae bacterium]
MRTKYMFKSERALEHEHGDDWRNDIVWCDENDHRLGSFLTEDEVRSYELNWVIYLASTHECDDAEIIRTPMSSDGSYIDLGDTLVCIENAVVGDELIVDFIDCDSTIYDCYGCSIDSEYWDITRYVAEVEATTNKVANTTPQTVSNDSSMLSMLDDEYYGLKINQIETYS